MWLWVTTWNLDCGTVRCNSPAVQCPFFTYVFLSLCLFYKFTDIRRPEELSLLRPIEHKKKKKAKDLDEEIYDLTEVPLSSGTLIALHSHYRLDMHMFYIWWLTPKTCTDLYNFVLTYFTHTAPSLQML